MKKILIILLTLAAITLIILRPTKTKFSTNSEEAIEYYKKGVNDFDILFYEGALHNFKKSFENDPNFAMASMQIALVLHRTGKKDSLNYYLDQAINLMDNTSRYEKLRIRYIKHMIYHEYLKFEHTTDSLLYEFPDDIVVKKINALIQFNRKNFKTAREIFLDILKDEPGYSMSYNMIAYSYLNQGLNKEAFKYFKKYIEMAPDQINPYDSMAEFYTITGKYTKVIETLEHLLETRKEQIDENAYLAMAIYSRLSISYQNLGQFENSLKYAKLSTLEHTPLYDPINKNTTLFNYYFRQKDYLSLENEFNRIKDKINPLLRDFLEIRLNICKNDFKSAAQKIDSMKKQQTSSSKNESKKEIIYLTSILEGELFFHQGNYSEATEKYDIATSLSKMEYQTSLIKIHQLISMFNTDQKDEAIKILESVLLKNPNDAFALFYISSFYYKMDNKKEAKYYINHFLDQWKNADKDNIFHKKALWLAEQIN